MSKAMTSDELLAVFPLFASEDMSALASAIANELQDLYDKQDRLGIYTRIRLLPEDLLDLLADDLKVGWYLPNGTLESKREQIANCFDIHRCLGTKKALLDGLSALCPGTEVEEWFHYAGTPYHFRVSIDLSKQTLPLPSSLLLSVIEALKPVRSIFDASGTVLKAKSDLSVSASITYGRPNRFCGTPLGALMS